MFFTGRRTARIIQEQAKIHQAALKAVTRGQRLANWLTRNVVHPVAIFLMVVGLAYAARLGWQLAG